MPRWIAKTGTACLTAVLMLLTCEAATRLFARVAIDVSQRDPLVGRTYYPHLNEYLFNHEANKPVFMRTNQYGFRGPEISAQKPSGTRRVAVLGDSYTAAMALEEDSTFCGQLQKELNSRHDESQRWEVLNFGVHGSGTGQELALYRNMVRDLSPDVVVVAFGNATDVRDNSIELSTNPIIQYELDERGDLVQLPQSQRRVQASNLLNQVSRFYTWQKLKLARLKRHIQAEAEIERGRHLIYARNEPESYARAWQLTGAILKAFRDECRQRGSQLIVVALPSAYQVYPDHFETLQGSDQQDMQLDPDHPDRRLQGICAELDICFHTLTPAFIEATPSRSRHVESEHLFIGGVSHFNERGSQVAAGQMAKWISHSQVAAVPRHTF